MTIRMREAREAREASVSQIVKVEPQGVAEGVVEPQGVAERFVNFSMVLL